MKIIFLLSLIIFN